MDTDTPLRETFDDVALLYNEARPRYPEELFEALITVAGLSAGAKLLEIGPGTGQATKPFATRGYDIMCIELGSALSEVARHELRNYPNVQIQTGAFEDVQLPLTSFDLVFAATAFHWIDNEVKFTKPHQVLKQGGHLAVIHTHHTSDEKGDLFYDISKPVFDRFGFSDTNRKVVLPKTAEVSPDKVDENLFKLTHFQIFPVSIDYSAKEFVNLMNTYSNHLVAPEQVRNVFFKEIEDLINEEFYGSITKHFSMSLTVAKKI